MGYLLVSVQLPDSASDERTARGACARSRRSCCEHAGRPARHGHQRAIVRCSAPPARTSARCSSASTIITIGAIRACRARRSSAKLNAGVQTDPRGDRAGLSAAAGARRGPGGRLHADGRGPRRPRLAGPARPRPKNLVAQANANPQLANAMSAFPRQRAAARRRARRARSAWRRASSLRRLRRNAAASISARCTSTTSTSSAAPGRCIVQADAPFRDQLEDICQAQGPQQRRARWCRSARWPTIRDVNGPLVLTRYNMYPAASINGAGKPGVSSGDAIAIMEELAEQELPAAHGLRVDRDGLSGADGRQHGDDHLRPGRGDGVSGAGRAVRKLVAAAGRDPGRADVPAQRHRRREPGRAWTSTSSRRSASWCWSAWPARTRS